MRETRGLDLEEGGSILSPPPPAPHPPNLARLPPGTPIAGVRPAPGLEHRAPAPGGGCGDGSVRLSSAPHPSAWLWVEIAPCWVFKLGLCRWARHGVAQHGTAAPPRAASPTPRSQPSVGGGRWPQVVPKPSPSQKMPRPSQGASSKSQDEPWSPVRSWEETQLARPGEREGADSLFARAGRRRYGRAGWAPWGTGWHCPCLVPLAPRDTPFAPHLPGAATPDGCRMLGRRDFPNVN